jgi:hypothetical protein
LLIHPCNARGTREKWTAWGNQADNYEITWPTYNNNSNGKKINGKSHEITRKQDSIQLSLSVLEKQKRYPVIAVN